MNQKIKKITGSVLIYALFLVNLALIMGVVVFNMFGNLFVNDYYYTIQAKFNNHINEKADLAFKYSKQVNSNGSGFIDAISCPTSITMSGTTLLANISTTISYSSGSIFCEGIYNSNPVYIYFNTGFTDFTGATYISNVGLTAGVGDSTFSDGDSTLMTFSPSGLGGIDFLDDDFNDDNYQISSSGTLYPNNFEDDDAEAKKNIYGYVKAGETKNIFWNYQKTSDFIAANVNNTGATLIGTSSGNIYMEADGNFMLQLVQFDRSSFTGANTLKVIETFTSNNIGSLSGFIQNDGSVSNLGMTKTSSEYLFDFSKNDYALFLSNYSTGALFFQMKSYTTTGSGIIMNPIDDSNPTFYRYLGADILTSDDGLFMYEERIITASK